MQTNTTKILVAGATGTVGRNIVEQLAADGYAVRALTRNPAKANFPAGVEVVAGDLTDPETLIPALEGITALHLITFGGGDYAPLQTGEAIRDLAKKAGVKRITVLSGGQRSGVEDALDAGDIPWTLIQPVEFMSNMKEWAESIRAEGVVREPYANRRSAIVHEADIAAVAAAALVKDGYGDKTLTVTGGEVLTPPQMVAAIGKAIGRDVQFIELTEAQARERWQAQGYPEEVIQFFMWAHGNTPEIGYTVVPTVQELTGRPPRTFAQWAVENADIFRS